MVSVNFVLGGGHTALSLSGVGPAAEKRTTDNRASIVMSNSPVVHYKNKLNGKPSHDLDAGGTEEAGVVLASRRTV